MKKKNNLTKLIVPLTIAILLFIPNQIVWGGQNYQTVPTIGSSNTATKTKIISETQTTSTKTPSPKITANKSITPAMSPTITPTVTATLKNLSKTAETKFTKTKLNQDPSLEPDSTMVVILPIVSNEGSQQDQPIIDEMGNIPAFIFPMVVVIIFLIIYVPARWLIKKTFSNKSDQNNP